MHFLPFSVILEELFVLTWVYFTFKIKKIKLSQRRKSKRFVPLNWQLYFGQFHSSFKTFMDDNAIVWWMLDQTGLQTRKGRGWLMDQTPGWMCFTIKTWMDLTITRDHHLPPTSWMDIPATVTADILTPANVHSWTVWKIMKMWLINIFTLNWSIDQSYLTSPIQSLKFIRHQPNQTISNHIKLN